jgi:hypothetical protein
VEASDEDFWTKQSRRTKSNEDLTGDVILMRFVWIPLPLLLPLLLVLPRDVVLVFIIVCEITMVMFNVILCDGMFADPSFEASAFF